jgi:phospholipid/cholesterol/gamma-HCH transport system ATP-binding protein
MVDEKDILIRSVQFIELGVAYESARPIFEGLTITPEMGKVVRVKGAAGSGKSTVLKIMAGLVAPSSGEYRINGQSISDMTFLDLIPYRLRIGYSFEIGGLLSNRTIEENLRLPLQFHQVMSVEKINERVANLIEFFGLEQVANTRPSEVSGSRRKAAVIARALIAEPELLLLDDPTTGLSDENKKNLSMYLVARRSEGFLQNVFIVSDDESFCETIVDSTIEIGNRGINEAA